MLLFSISFKYLKLNLSLFNIYRITKELNLN